MTWQELTSLATGSNAIHQIGNADAESFCDLPDVSQGHVSLAAFDATHVRPIPKRDIEEVRFLG